MVTHDSKKNIMKIATDFVRPVFGVSRKLLSMAASTFEVELETDGTLMSTCSMTIARATVSYMSRALRGPPRTKCMLSDAHRHGAALCCLTQSMWANTRYASLFSLMAYDEEAHLLSHTTSLTASSATS